MVTVYIWLPTSENYGHAGLRVRNGAPSNDTYVSWWPEETGFWRSYRIVTGVPATQHRVVGTDLSDEGARDPEHIIQVGRLDEGAIVAWWGRWRMNLSYRLVDRNCCTTVVRALEAGGAMQYVQDGAQVIGPVLSPYRVLQFVQDINIGQARLSLYGRSEGVRRAMQMMNGQAW